MTDDLPKDNNVVDDSASDASVSDTQISHPKSPEQGIPVGTASVESLRPESTETEPTPEVSKSIQKEPIKKQKEEEVLVSEQPAQPQAQHVIDKRMHVTKKGTPLKTSHKLTQEADVGEQEFIDHVEKVHSIA